MISSSEVDIEENLQAGHSQRPFCSGIRNASLRPQQGQTDNTTSSSQEYVISITCHHDSKTFFVTLIFWAKIGAVLQSHSTRVTNPPGECLKLQHSYEIQFFCHRKMIHVVLVHYSHRVWYIILRIHGGQRSYAHHLLDEQFISINGGCKDLR